MSKYELKMCECGEPTYSSKCELCFADEAVTPLEQKRVFVNERIKQLRDHCTEYSEMTHDMFFDSDKFAELIIRECNNYVDELIDGLDPWQRPAWMEPGGLLKHFGIKHD